MAASPLIACLSAMNSLVQRALPIRILTVGKKRSRGVQLLVDEYSEELNYYCSVEHVQLRSNPRNARVLSEEASLFMVISTETKFLGDAIMLDEGGSDISSEHMAELIGDAGMMVCSFAHSGVIYSQMYQLPQDNILINFLSCRLNFAIYFVLYTIHGASRLSYYIGGPYGHGKGMLERANKSVKLFSLVLNHDIALLVIIEQLYRYEQTA
ncbi:hypothetical protein V2J09_011073 [Rumex salicifolius]